MNVIIGEVQALLTLAQFAKFLQHYAGTNVTITSRRKGASFAELSRVVGERAAITLCDTLAPACVYVARNALREHAERNIEIARRVAAGESTASIARSYRYTTTLSVRHVRRIAAAVMREANDGVVADKAACESR